jgi:hypothetical protein
MRHCLVAIVLVAVFPVACSSSEDGGVVSNEGAIVGSIAPATGMDGRPAGIAVADPDAPDRTGLSGGDPAPWEGRGVRGPSGPPAAIVPDVRGMLFSDAVRLLWRAGIDFEAVYARTADDPRWSVIEQIPPPGSNTPDSGAINLVLSMSEASAGAAMVRCRPVLQHLSNPYCVGKLLKY